MTLKRLLLIALALPIFAVQPPLTVVYPNGGEVLVPNTPVTIRWNGASPGMIVIMLFRDGVQHAILSEQVANSGQFIWKVAANLPPSGHYRIRIRSLADLAVNDFSDNDFTIRR